MYRFRSTRRPVAVRPAHLILIFTAAVCPPARAVNIDWVTVGDPGNACAVQSQGCFGAVASNYRISKFGTANALRSASI